MEGLSRDRPRRADGRGVVALLLLLGSWLPLESLNAQGVSSTRSALPATSTLVQLDLAHDTARQVLVDREQGVYLGHPTTVLLEDGRTMLCVYPRGHGKGPILMKRSTDGGRTWSERLPTPDNWATSQETPTIHRVTDPEGVKRLIVWSGLYPARLSVSEDDGEHWSPLAPVGDWGGIVVMGSVVETGVGEYRAYFHDDGRFLTEDGSAGAFHVYGVRSVDGGLNWSTPEIVAQHPTAHLCEPGVVRSPDGKRLAMLLRENSRQYNSFIVFSEDQGATWSEPRELPASLTGDRHVGRYAPDGRLVLSFRDTGRESPTQGDWVAWVGRFEDLEQGLEGEYRVRLMDNKHRWDCAYPGVEVLPDGTFVATTYGHWTEGQQPYVVSVRFQLEELDALLAAEADDAAVEEQAQLSKPNILLLLADDQGWADLGSMGLADDVHTPALDRLAERSVSFRQAYATSPICNPARAGIMTGSYTQRFGTRWYGGRGLHDERFQTVAELLTSAGYATGYVGKFHYGAYDQHVPGNRNFPLEHGFESFYGSGFGRTHYLLHNTAAEQAFQASKKLHQRTGQSLRMGPLWEGDSQVDQVGFSTELFGERARAYLDEHVAQAGGQPFFLMLSFNAVHNFTHQLPEAYLAEKGLEAGHDWDPAQEEYIDWYRRGRAPNNPEGRAHYLGQLHYLDLEVGRVLEHLDDLGLTDETLVLYLGDNGGSRPIYADNGPLRGGKYTLYEGGVRVPFMMSWPGQWPAGVVKDDMISAMDLLPTLCSVAQIAVPAHVDGLDLGPLLAGAPDAPRHDILFWDTGHESAVRRGNWKLHVALRDDHARYEMTELELGTHLYDLAADPGEQNDLSAEHPELVRELQAAWDTWHDAVQGEGAR